MISSCKEVEKKDKQTVVENSNGSELELLKEASNYNNWIRVRKYEDLFAIYIPCEGKTMELFKNGNELEITETIEDLILPINKEIIIDNNSFRIYTSETDYFMFTVFSKQKKIFQCKYFEKGREVDFYNMLVINKELSSLFDKKKQPCTDCFSKEECDRFKNINSQGYNKPNTIVTPKNEWFGEYYFEEGETGKVILISDNKITYEAIGTRYYANYELSANQVGDTLGW